MSNVARILLLDDELALREEVADYLRNAGHHVDEAGSIRQFRQYVPARTYDILLIDRALPDGEGLELLEQLQAEGIRSGVIMFTARDASQDRIHGYRAGADHYVTKPVRLDELKAIVESVARRVAPRNGWRLSTTEWILRVPGGDPVSLTGPEHCMLLALARAPRQFLSRQQIAALLGKDLAQYDLRNLDALVRRLRRKTDEVTNLGLPLKSVHGAGYSLIQAMILD